jgi:hypothetical protein
MKFTFIHTIVALGVAAGLAVAMPQTAQAKAKAPKEHSVTGCLQKGDSNTYVLTGVGKKGAKRVDIVESASSLNLGSQVGHKVTIKGSDVSPGTTKGERHLRAEQVKMLSATCS